MTTRRRTLLAAAGASLAAPGFAPALAQTNRWPERPIEIVVGFVADHSSWALAVSTTAVFPMLALGIILARFPETRGKELEETAKF